jgi:hypothetical protein
LYASIRLVPVLMWWAGNEGLRWPPCQHAGTHPLQWQSAEPGEGRDWQACVAEKVDFRDGLCLAPGHLFQRSNASHVMQLGS